MYVLTLDHMLYIFIQVYIMYEPRKSKSRRRQPSGVLLLHSNGSEMETLNPKPIPVRNHPSPECSIGERTKPIPVRNQPTHNVQLGREPNPFQYVTIPLQNVQWEEGNQTQPIPVHNQPIQNVQWEEGTKPIPVRNQPIQNVQSRHITGLRTMMRARIMDHYTM